MPRHSAPSTSRRLVGIAASLVCLTLGGLEARAQAVNVSPQIARIEPAIACQGCAIRIVGAYLFGADGYRTWLIRPGLQREVPTPGGGVISFDPDAPQPNHYLIVAVPDDAPTGAWQVVVETPYGRSPPVSLRIDEWRPPVLTRIEPDTVAPGQSVTLRGTNFPSQLTMLLVDDTGATRQRIDASAQPDRSGFRVPDDAGGGLWHVVIETPRDGGPVLSPGLPLLVATRARAPVVSTDLMEPVGPGQWTALSMDFNRHQLAYERVEVEFRQDGRVAISEHDRGRDDRIRVPETLAGGMAAIRARVQVNGRWSPWSQPGDFEILAAPADPFIDAIALVRDHRPLMTWSAKEPLPLRLRPGDIMMVLGRVPFADVYVVATSSAAARPVMLPIALDFQTPQLAVVVPDLAPGTWTIAITDDPESTSVRGGVVVQVDP